MGLVCQSRQVFGSAVSKTPVNEARNSLIGISSSTSGCGAKWAISPITSRHGTGRRVSGIRGTRGRTFPWARRASLAYAPHCWIQILQRRLIPSSVSMASTQPRLEPRFMSPCITRVSTNCPSTTPPLTVICSTSPPARCHLLSAVSTTRRDSPATGMC
jgi:hypothetical protein